MFMRFPYTTIQIQEIVRSPKVLRRPELLHPEKPIPFQSYERESRRLDLDLDVPGHPSILALRFHVRGPVPNNPETYEAALILANERIRGIGWHATGKKRLYGKQVVPKGWHQNVLDPNLPKRHSDMNRHLPLENFNPTDLTDFFLKAASLWHIDLAIAKGLFE